jgi:hypothetical protein
MEAYQITWLSVSVIMSVYLLLFEAQEAYEITLLSVCVSSLTF